MATHRSKSQKHTSKQVQQMELRRVNHLAVVHAYYGDRMRVKRSSLQIPEKAYFVSAQSTNPKTLRKAGCKRARELVRQEERIAAGTFVPLDETLKAALLRAHEGFLSEGELVDIVPATASDGDADVRKCGFEDGITAAFAIASDEKLHANDTDDFQIVAMQDSGSSVLLPARSSFAVCDVRSLTDLPLGHFKLIVMDPPWENKSVGRSKRYTMFHHTQLLKIDVCSLADNDECVLGIWVTNRPQYTTFLLDTVLPRWGFTYHTTWYWLKVCRNGDLVTPLESTHRLPFEKMIVAYRCKDDDPARQEALMSRLGESTKILVSVPLRHSWKPPPECIFDASIIAPDTRKLELFARELRPGWTSIGNERERQS
ncbi:Methyltransferase-like protein 4, partial [Globisporangium splendens]